MAKTRSRRSRARPTHWAQMRQALGTARRWLVQRELWGVGVTAFGAVTLISLVSRDQGRWSGAWSLLLRQIFGLGAYPIALLILGSGIVLLLWNTVQGRLSLRWEWIVGGEILFFSALGLLHLSAHEAAWALAQAGEMGGHVGWTFVHLLVPAFGQPISILLVGLLMLGGLALLTRTSWRDVRWRVRWLWARAGVPLRTRLLARQHARAVAAARQAAPSTPPTPNAHASPPEPTPPLEATRGQMGPRSSPTPARRPRKVSATRLPPLELLLPDASSGGDEADARMRAQIIQETLDSFGVPAKVVEWRRGPVVTQFGIVPGYVERQDREGNTRRYKIRVSKILSLSNDLALALAATPIRIEAPVPGRHVIGIEVPNPEKAIVGLRGVLESPEFQKRRVPLRVALGRDVSGAAVVADLGRMPHLLLAGATGSGKSACLNAILASLLFFHTPEELKLLLVDPKRVELTRYNRIPHLLAPVVVDTEKVIVALRWVIREMESRYEAFAKVGARSIEGYNRTARSKGQDVLPFIVVVIDELADVMLAAPDEVERTLCRIAQMARATGIHLVVATQRPSVDVVTGLIKANFPARVSFAVSSQVDSRVILDTPGAEKLLGRGDMLYMASDSPELRRVQGCWVSEEELDALVRFWAQASAHDAEDDEPPPWEGMSLDEDEEDELLQDAIALVREHEQASASFLQRQMRIGYPRAARLIDELERKGIVGPAESGGRSRAVLMPDDLDGADGANEEPDQREAPEEQGVEQEP